MDTIYGIDDDGCAAKCAEKPGCNLALYVTVGACFLWSTPCQPSSMYFYPGRDIYIMVPQATCPNGTTSNGTACNPCTVANCDYCDPGSPSTCAKCGLGYTLSSGQCSAPGEHSRLA